MVVKVISVSSEITFTFSNGATYTLPVSTGVNNLSNYCTSINTDEKLCSNSNSNVVGNITGNTISLSLVSRDKLLVPNNRNSAYFGYMNNSCKIDIYYTVHYSEQSSERVYMGRYYVSSWESGTSNSKSEEVSILAVNLLGRAKNIPLGKMKMQKYLNVNDFMKDVVDTINSNNLALFDHIGYTSESIDLFRNSSYTWQLVFNNIDRSTFESLLNDISKNTCSYWWIDRDNVLWSDHLLDDSTSESVGTLSGSENLLTYDVKTGGIGQYNGVKVKYIDSIDVESTTLLELKNPTVYVGNNVVEDQKMNSDNVQNIRMIECNNDASAVPVVWYKDSLDISVDCTSENVDIKTIRVRGDKVNENFGTVSKYRSTSRDSVLEVTNRVLRKELMNTYVDGVLNIMSMKNNIVECSGFINPKLRLGNTVRFIGSRIGVDDYYKILGLKTTLSGGNYKCVAMLQKFIGTELNPVDAIAEQTELLKQRLSGLYVNPADVKNISEYEALLCENDFGDAMAALRARLAGGV